MNTSVSCSRGGHGPQKTERHRDVLVGGCVQEAAEPDLHLHFSRKPASSRLVGGGAGYVDSKVHTKISKNCQENPDKEEPQGREITETWLGPDTRAPSARGGRPHTSQKRQAFDKWSRRPRKSLFQKTGRYHASHLVKNQNKIPNPSDLSVKNETTRKSEETVREFFHTLTRER